MRVAIAADPVRAVAYHAVSGDVVAAITVLLFKAPGRQLVTAARADVVASVKLYGDRAQTVDQVGLIGETGPTCLRTDVILRPSIRAKRSQREYRNGTRQGEPYQGGPASADQLND